MEKNFVVGVEGEVGAGKTSMCKELVKIIPNTIFIDGGAIFRGITLAIKKGKEELVQSAPTLIGDMAKNLLKKLNVNVDAISSMQADALDLMKALNVNFKIQDNQTAVYIGDKEVKSDEFETEENAMDVSRIASQTDNKALFTFAHNLIQEYSKTYNIIVSARDLVEIYPEMDLHLYVTADLDKRIERRYNQYNGKYTREEIAESIKTRDNIHKDAGFNKKCDRTVALDLSDCENSEQSAKKALEIFKKYNLV